MCNEKCKHGLGRGCYLFNGNIIDSIRLVPGSNPGQPIVLSCAVVTYLSSKVKKSRILGRNFDLWNTESEDYLFFRVDNRFQ